MSSSRIAGTVEPVKIEFRWKVEQFSSKINLNAGTPLYSPSFYSPLRGNRVIKWCLKMYPGGETEESKDFIGLHLVCCSNTAVRIVYSLSILNETTNTVYENKSRLQDEFDGEECSWGYPNFLQTKLIVNKGRNMLADDSLTVSCEISFPDLHKYNDDADDIDERNTVNNYYEELLTNGKFSDITVVIEGQILLLHKNILSSSSPVFQAMFDHNMRENNENQLEITDIRADVALEMFRYMYCWKINNMDINAVDLFKAADKYSIMGLKKLCEKKLSKSLSLDNALKCLVLVTMYETLYLKPKVIEFVLVNLKELVKKPEYKQLPVECKDEIILAVAGATD